MPQNTTALVPAGVWTQLTDDNVSAIAIQNQSGHILRLQATNGLTAPTGFGGAIDLLPYANFTAAHLLSELWPGVPGANRVWAWSTVAANVRVSHA